MIDPNHPSVQAKVLAAEGTLAGGEGGRGGGRVDMSDDIPSSVDLKSSEAAMGREPLHVRSTDALRDEILRHLEKDGNSNTVANGASQRSKKDRLKTAAASSSSLSIPD